MKILIEKKGFEEGMVYNLEKKTAIGRDPGNSIQLLDPKVSRNHAEIIQREDHTYVLKDLGSANGTFLNGVPVPALSEKPLNGGEDIMVGDTILRFEESSVLDDNEGINIKITSERTETTTRMDFSKPAEEQDVQACTHIKNPRWSFCPICGKKMK